MDDHQRTVMGLVDVYVDRLNLPTDTLRVTTNRREFEGWLGRRVNASIGGAYVYLRHSRTHAVLINVARIATAEPRSLEVVVAEELIHMRDWIDGDRRRHAHHGHDRIAWRVVDVTGATIDEVRGAVVPVQRRPYRYVYECPGCGFTVPRRRRGRWSCRRCAPRFDDRFELKLVAHVGT